MVDRIRRFHRTAIEFAYHAARFAYISSYKGLGVKTLHLLRHAKADPADDDADDTQEDHARPLSKRGRKAADSLAEHMAAAEFKVDRVYCSTAARARQTLEPLRPVLAGTPIAFRDTLYLIEPETLLEFLRT